MVARARDTRAEETAGLIADQGGGTRLASIHSKKKLGARRQVELTNWMAALM
jgi:hypothetical protein